MLTEFTCDFNVISDNPLHYVLCQWAVLLYAVPDILHSRAHMWVFVTPPTHTHTHMKYYRHNPKTSEYVNGVKLVDEIWNWFNHTLIYGN